LTGSIEDIRLEMETHFFGSLNVIRAFAPVIERNGGGAILNVLSVLSWLHVPALGAYSAAKAAAWAMTDAVREELAPRGIHVAALHVGYMDTDMAAHAPADQKSDPAVVARLALDGLFAGAPEILADERSRTVKLLLSQTPGA
jgi:NAD(P)-dependent dehydrogenase (short-subunit alcohol dehydrogenase family)